MAWKPDYASSADLKSYLRIDDSADDVFVALWVTTTSRNVDDFCGRQFGHVDASETRQYATAWDRHLCRYVAGIDDLSAVDDLTVVDGAGVAVTDYELEPVNALQNGKVFERILTRTAGPLTIETQNWGWTDVPAAVKIGLFLQAARLAARRDSPFGVAGSPSEGSEIRLLAQLDPDFKTSLKPLQRKWWAA